MIYEFEMFSINAPGRELKNGGTDIVVEPLVFDLILYLVENRDRVVSKDELISSLWKGRSVSDSALASRINAARKALGDTGAKQVVIRTSARKGYRFIADVRIVHHLTAANHDDEAGLQNEIRYCLARGGVKIAYASVGKGPPLVKAGNWLNHIEYDWQSPVWSPLLHWLAHSNQLVRYDARGNGLSDWDVGDITLDDFVADLEAVVDAMELKRFNLFGVSQGCAVSVAYAVRHPERVSRLVLYGGFALGRSLRGSASETGQAEALLTLMRTGWGQDNPAFRQIFTSLFMPGATQDQMNWFNNLQKITASPENAVKMRRVSDTLDITDLLPRVRAPTLVLHCLDDAVQPFSEGRRLAMGIPGAQFVPLAGANHLILESDPGWPRFKSEVAAFLTL